MADKPQEQLTKLPEPTKITNQSSMNDADRDELNRLRAAEAAREQEAKEREQKAKETIAKSHPAWMDLPVPEQIQDHYLHARGSIQDYARIYKMTVEEVLAIIQQKHDIGNVVEVETLGDLIDASDINTQAGDKPFQTVGSVARANFSTN